MKPFLDRIKNGEILISDGALGTMLFDAGMEPGKCPELLVLEKPELLRNIALEYVQAGADIIHTNTFGASPLKLSDYGLEDKAEEINRKSVELLQDVAGDSICISGSCGPTGRVMEPYGNTDPEEVTFAFEHQIQTMVDAGVNMICIETMIDLREAVLAVKAVRKVSIEIPVMVSMTFDSTPNGFFTIWGASIPDAVKELETAGADIVGSNCGNGIAIMVEIARCFRKETKIPLLIQSNAGQPELRNGKIVYSESPVLFAEKALELADIGVSIIGGCCGTTPRHIEAISRVIRK
ncbi:MAG: homocysteine S-methyltransferase family protein [FCB group bacterium]|nr:homocysteine S-methyltransferase family protein [FCB group bacterium]